MVRSWYSRLPAIVQNAYDLVANSEECARACVEGETGGTRVTGRPGVHDTHPSVPPPSGSLPRLGACLDRFWRQKKVMAPGCEPASVKVMMEALRPLVLGQTLAGAGGGGFLYLLTREPGQKEEVLRLLSRTPVRTGSWFHDAN